MPETSEVRRRLRAVMAEARENAAARRERVATATRDGQRVLSQVAAPVFRAMASAARPEGFTWRVDTPAASIRLVMDGTGSSFVELALETADDPPRLLVRVSRARGRRVLVDEWVVRRHPEIGGLTEAEVLDLLAAALPPFVE